jgi:3-hydroxyisobutyrate dehydrogenase
MARLGWIGLGRLGGRLAPRLLQAGHELIVHDLDPARTVPGASRAPSAAEVAAVSETVFLCVTDTEAVDAVAREIARIDGRGKLVVDHSTVDPDRTREMAARLNAANGMGWVDAPLSGPVGSCAAFLGGEAADVARVRLLIECYAGAITHMGPLGAGQLAKSASQLVVAAAIAAWGEALDYARALGLDPAALVEACVGAGSDSSVRGHFGPQLATGSLSRETIRNMIKDMGIVTEVARGARVSMPLAEVVRSRLGKGESR